MVEPSPGWTFPFGRPVQRRRPSAKSRRRVFVLGAYPGALHIAWWSPARKEVKALPVDNEPAAFWTGSDERTHIDEWKRAVGFRVGEWGEVETSDEVNGKAGRWLDDAVLSPLGVTRDEACLSYCVDTCFADAAVGFAVSDRYQPVASEAGLPEARLPPRPRDGALVALAVEAHRQRLLRELAMVVPEIVVTLGNAALRVLRAITEAKGGLARLHPDASYGLEQPLTFGTRRAAWIALTHHEAAPIYAEAHACWRERLSSRA
jgi:uracil-DNA glycosylase